MKLIKPDSYKDLDFEKELWKAADKLRILKVNPGGAYFMNMILRVEVVLLMEG